MRVIDRLHQYLQFKQLSPYTFERSCGIANGYLKKQIKGKGSIGSEILEKIVRRYSDLSLTWLVTGQGTMLNAPGYTPVEHDNDQHIQDRRAVYVTDEGTVHLLREKIAILESAVADKDKIIRLIETQAPR